MAGLPAKGNPLLKSIRDTAGHDKREEKGQHRRGCSTSSSLAGWSKRTGQEKDHLHYNHPDLASSFHTRMQVNWLLLSSQRSSPDAWGVFCSAQIQLCTEKKPTNTKQTKKISVDGICAQIM